MSPPRRLTGPPPLATAEATRIGGPADGAGPSIVPRVVPLVTLIVVVTAVLAATLRVSFPLLYDHIKLPGFGNVVIVPLAYLAGMLALGVRALTGSRGVLIVGVGGLLACRLVAQGLPPTYWLALAGTAFAVLAVVALYDVARGMSGGGFTVAVLGGLALDAAIRLAFGTLDVAWQTGAVAWVSCLVPVGVAAAALVVHLRARSLAPPGVAWRDAIGAAACGPFLALQLLLLANPAYVASVGGVSAPVAGAVVLGAQALAIVLLTSGVAARAVPGGVCVLGGTVLGISVAAVSGTYGFSGPGVVAVVVAGQVLSAWLFAVACRASLGHLRSGAGSPVRVDLAAAAGGFLVFLVVLPYQLHYEAPLPFSNAFLPGAAGLLLGLAAATTAARGGPPPRRSPRRVLVAAAASLVLLVIPLFQTVAAPETTRAAATPGSARVVSYNIHEAVDSDRRLNPEAIAVTIERQRPDVVLLQEVGRGWPESGMADMGEWLARRLGMRLVWGPAAENQFGNAVLTRLPVRATGAGRLPQGNGSQIRGYVWARVDVGGGRTLDAWSTHLQHRDDQTLTRLAEAETLLRAWSGAPNTVIGGDMNAGPGSREMGRFFDQTGLRSAQDDTGHGSLPTFPPTARLDWVLGTGDLEFGDFAIDRRVTSDHLPLAVTVRLRG